MHGPFLHWRRLWRLPTSVALCLPASCLPRPSLNTCITHDPHTPSPTPYSFAAWAPPLTPRARLPHLRGAGGRLWPCGQQWTRPTWRTGSPTLPSALWGRISSSSQSMAAGEWCWGAAMAAPLKQHYSYNTRLQQYRSNHGVGAVAQRTMEVGVWVVLRKGGSRAIQMPNACGPDLASPTAAVCSGPTHPCLRGRVCTQSCVCSLCPCTWVQVGASSGCGAGSCGRAVVRQLQRRCEVAAEGWEARGIHVGVLTSLGAQVHCRLTRTWDCAHTIM